MYIKIRKAVAVILKLRKHCDGFIISTYFYSSDATGSFDVCVEKKTKPMSMEHS